MTKHDLWLNRNSRGWIFVLLGFLILSLSLLSQFWQPMGVARALGAAWLIGLLIGLAAVIYGVWRLGRKVTKTDI